MKRWFGVVALTAAGLAGATWLVPSAAAETKKGGGKPTSEPATAVYPIRLTPNGIHFGMTYDEIATFYDKVIDSDFAGELRKARPGPDLNALEARIEDRKDAFRRTKVEFGDLPTGIDQNTAIRPEYAYHNTEGYMSITRAGYTRYLFFFGGKVWKLYDEFPLKAGGELGASFQDAVGTDPGHDLLKQRFGVPGRILPPDPANGRMTNEVDWADATIHVRAVERPDEAVMALVFEDKVTLAAVMAGRKAHPENGGGIDPAILAATRQSDGGIVDPNAQAADAYTGRVHQGPTSGGPKKK